MFVTHTQTHTQNNTQSHTRTVLLVVIHSVQQNDIATHSKQQHCIAILRNDKNNYRHNILCNDLQRCKVQLDHLRINLFVNAIFAGCTIVLSDPVFLTADWFLCDCFHFGLFDQVSVWIKHPLSKVFLVMVSSNLFIAVCMFLALQNRDDCCGDILPWSFCFVRVVV